MNGRRLLDWQIEMHIWAFMQQKVSLLGVMKLRFNVCREEEGNVSKRDWFWGVAAWIRELMKEF